MVRELIKKLSLSSFAENENGNIFITTAFAAPMLILAVGISIDSAEIYRARVNFQNAIDAGTLVAAKITAAKGGGAAAREEAITAGRNVFNANMRNLISDPEKATIDFTIHNTGCAAGSISSTATLNQRVFFDFYHKVSGENGLANHVEMEGVAEVRCGNTRLEMALVLDNSGSMRDAPAGDPHGQTKIKTLRKASTKMVKTLHDSFGTVAGVSDPLKISVVPFSTMVNVGTSYKSADWMDKDGLSSIHHENLNWDLDPIAIKNATGYGYKDASGNALTRFTIFNQLGVTWKGCVETRPYPLLTNDTPPSITDPDSLFVPSFAPDTPSTLWDGLNEELYYNNYISDRHNFPASLNATLPSEEYMGSLDGKQYSRMKWTWKYFADASGNKPTHNGGVIDNIGPNNGCRSVPVSPLTADKAKTDLTLKNMKALGATNIQQGAVWGWRTLSESEPFTQGRDEGTASNRKAMILMTDGENTYYPTRYWGGGISERTKSTYGAYGFAVNKRMFAEDGGFSAETHTFDYYTTSMNKHLLETCINARAAGIEIYTIAFDVAEDSPSKELLEQCASPGPTGVPLYYLAENSDDLTNIFASIADTLSDLRLSK